MVVPADAVNAISRMEAVKDNPSLRATLMRDAATLIAGLTWTSEELLNKLCDGCLFCQDPRMALHYYHGLSMDHEAWLYNNESLDDPVVLNRVLAALEEPVGKEEAVELHEALRVDGDGAISACASCNEFQVAAWGDTIEKRDISKPGHLHKDFYCTKVQSGKLEDLTEL